MCERSREATCVELVCPAGRDRRETRAPGVDALLEVSCLAGLATSLLVAIAAERDCVWLDDSPCGGCALASNRDDIAMVAEVARRTLATWGRAGAIRTYAEDSDALEHVPHKVRHLGDARPRPTRRQFLWPVRRPGVDAGARRTGDADLVLRALGVLGRREEHAPIPRERFGRLRAAESCSACGACAKVCPTSALVATASSTRFVLGLTPTACLGPACSLCALACPAGALSIREADAGWLRRDADTVLDLAVAPCDECHAPVASRLGERLCASCRSRRDGRSALIAEILPRA